MNDMTAVIAIVIGLIVRLGIPVLVTAFFVLALRRLDTRWQAEASSMPLKVEKPRCWQTQGCAPSKRKACAGFKSPLPCWQVFRLPSGYLNEKCLGCKVFAQAPLPARV
jgi:hypothetical protein